MDSRHIALTFDVENDCSLDSFIGIELGLPKIILLLKKYNIPATFFVTGQVAELFPEVIRELGEQYEIGCHGYYHESFQEVDSHKKNLLNSAKNLLEETTGKNVIGFRAPYLRTSQPLFKTLKELGFKYDSSLALFKISHKKITPTIKEYRLMMPNVFFRFPLGNRLFKVACLLNNISTLYFHPWEAIDVRRLLIPRPNYFWNIISRPDRWLNSGTNFLSLLSNFIRDHLQRGITFKSLKDLYLEAS